MATKTAKRKFRERTTVSRIDEDDLELLRDCRAALAGEDQGWEAWVDGLLEDGDRSVLQAETAYWGTVGFVRGLEAAGVERRGLMWFKANARCAVGQLVLSRGRQNRGDARSMLSIYLEQVVKAYREKVGQSAEEEEPDGE